tara:strand:+ start:276 stop:563 length:288 start_codon:yes stop_codon:yes gene_type:complete
VSYKLEFHKLALKEWHKLDHTLQAQFKTKISLRLDDPHVPSGRLMGTKNRYKIKLRSSGYRLVYSVIDDRLIVQVVAIGKREQNSVYKNATNREN